MTDNDENKAPSAEAPLPGDQMWNASSERHNLKEPLISYSSFMDLKDL